MERLVVLVQMESEGSLENQALRVLVASPEREATLAPLGNPAERDPLDPPVPVAPLAPPVKWVWAVSQEMWAELASVDPRALKGRRGERGRWVQQESQVPRDRPDPLAPPALWPSREIGEPPARPASQELLVLTAAPDPPGPLDLKATTESPDYLESQEGLVPQAHQDPEVIQDLVGIPGRQE